MMEVRLILLIHLIWHFRKVYAGEKKNIHLRTINFQFQLIQCWKLCNLIYFQVCATALDVNIIFYCVEYAYAYV